MIKKIVPLAGVLLLLVACGGSGSSDANRGPNSEARAVAFKNISGEMKTIGDILKENRYDVESFKGVAAALVEKSTIPFQHMARDGAGEDGKALPAVWDSAEEYQKEQEKFLNAVQNFNEAAQEGDLDKIKATFGEVGASCKSCHTGFKS